MSNYLVWH
jgi:hypothetical protein